MTDMTPMPERVDARAVLERWRARRSEWPAMEELWDALKTSEQARQRMEERQTTKSLTVIVEDWLHNHLDAEFRPTPRATMRWQWCKRPGYPKDHDCAACLMTPEDAATEGKVGSACECICHERVRSLVAFLLAALAPDGSCPTVRTLEERDPDGAPVDGG